MGGISEPIWGVREHLECGLAGQFAVAFCVKRRQFFLFTGWGTALSWNGQLTGSYERCNVVLEILFD